jgi:hypothetical protein
MHCADVALFSFHFPLTYEQNGSDIFLLRKSLLSHIHTH